MSLRIGSLCSGYGGLDAGLQSVVGGTVAWHAEYDTAPALVLAERFPGVPNLGDITTTDWTAVEPVDWLTAGYPCQPFSQAGKRKGTADERHLWPYVAGAVRVLRPRHVLFENVRGHVRLGLDGVLADLAGLGYVGCWGVLRASDAGAPHSRARVFIVATDASGAGRGRPWSAVGSGTPSGGAPGGLARGGRGRGAAWDAEGHDEWHVGVAGDGGPWGDEEPPGTAGRVVADSSGYGWNEGRTESAGVVGGSDAAVCGDADGDPNDEHQAAITGVQSWANAEPRGDHAPDTDGRGREVGQEQHSHTTPHPTDWSPCGGHVDGRSGADAWGQYGSAVARWEAVLGRPAPAPTVLGVKGQPRLSARAVEFLMGLPDGWVTDVPGLSRNAMLKILGNGVVPAQCALAVRTLLPLLEAQERAA